MNPWIVTSYFTENTFYEDLAKTFIQSMDKLSIPYDVSAIKNQRDWYKHVNYKPVFLLSMLKQYPKKNIIWVDCDAEFKRYPDLFDSLSNDNLSNKMTCSLAAFEFSHAKYYRRPQSTVTELLSGTLFLQNNEQTFDIVTRWVQQCKNNPKVWDQKSLQKVVGNSYYKLPGEYCCIHNVMVEFAKPVILHYQASRKVRKDKSLLRNGARS